MSRVVAWLRPLATSNPQCRHLIPSFFPTASIHQTRPLKINGCHFNSLFLSIIESDGVDLRRQTAVQLKRAEFFFEQMSWTVVFIAIFSCLCDADECSRGSILKLKESSARGVMTASCTLARMRTHQRDVFFLALNLCHRSDVNFALYQIRLLSRRTQRQSGHPAVSTS